MMEVRTLADMEQDYIIELHPLTAEGAVVLSRSGRRVVLSEAVKDRIRQNRAFLERRVAESDQPVYGINTGFGSLCNIRISGTDLEVLQHNLVRSHAAGAGDEVPEEIVRLMLLLKVLNLSHGYSGVRVELVEALLGLYNAGVSPVVYQLGSLGASGDLAPLAHLSLPLIGEGDVNYKGVRMPSQDALAAIRMKPLPLQSKEGLALLNGTQFSLAYGLWALGNGSRLWATANACAALSHDAFHGSMDPFHQAIHGIRPHKGQVLAAAAIRELLKGSEIDQQQGYSVQDPYAFRCVPQVHGASWTALHHAAEVIETELNGVTDNPNVIESANAILSGGNFHAQPLALVFDYMAVALAELGNISERRTFQLMSGQRGLNPFLAANPGLQSGLMIAQYTAAAIVSQNKQLSTPASVDSIVSSNGQEDHVSMAANGATRLYRMVENLERLLAIEWMSAARAMAFRRPFKTSEPLESVLEKYRKIVPELDDDRVLSGDIQRTLEFLQSGTFQDILTFSQKPTDSVSNDQNS
jgi:histidine ammonia-lyase